MRGGNRDPVATPSPCPARQPRAIRPRFLKRPIERMRRVAGPAAELRFGQWQGAAFAGPGHPPAMVRPAILDRRVVRLSPGIARQWRRLTAHNLAVTENQRMIFR
jgi:hypothetical protein